MKIDKLGKTLPSNMIGDGATRITPNKPNPAPQQSSTSVSLGSTASQLNKMEASVANTPVVDAGKVSEIKQAISDGRFQVNSGVVADRLIQSVRELISSGSKV